MRVRRRAKVRREGFSDSQRAHLLAGPGRLYFDGEGYGGADRFDLEAAARDWADHRDELVAFWLTNPGRWRQTHRATRLDPAPGGLLSRPWAWWAFDSPRELRRVIAGAVPWVPVVDWLRHTSFGCPIRFTADPHGVMRWETEEDFLVRHHLLTPPERRALRAAGGTTGERDTLKRGDNTW